MRKDQALILFFFFKKKNKKTLGYFKVSCNFLLSLPLRFKLLYHRLFRVSITTVLRYLRMSAAETRQGGRPPYQRRSQGGEGRVSEFQNLRWGAGMLSERIYNCRGLFRQSNSSEVNKSAELVKIDALTFV